MSRLAFACACVWFCLGCKSQPQTDPFLNRSTIPPPATNLPPRTGAAAPYYTPPPGQFSSRPPTMQPGAWQSPATSAPTLPPGSYPSYPTNPAPYGTPPPAMSPTYPTTPAYPTTPNYPATPGLGSTAPNGYPPAGTTPTYPTPNPTYPTPNPTAAPYWSGAGATTPGNYSAPPLPNNSNFNATPGTNWPASNGVPNNGYMPGANYPPQSYNTYNPNWPGAAQRNPFAWQAAGPAPATVGGGGWPLPNQWTQPQIQPSPNSAFAANNGWGVAQPNANLPAGVGGTVGTPWTAGAPPNVQTWPTATPTLPPNMMPGNQPAPMASMPNTALVREIAPRAPSNFSALPNTPTSSFTSNTRPEPRKLDSEFVNVLDLPDVVQR